MGLTIHYKLSVAENLPSSAAWDMVQRAGLYAKKIGCAEVSDVMRVEKDTPFASLFVRAGEEKDCCFGHVPARRGWVVEVWPGEGCESAHFGLCQYPKRAPFALRGRYGTVRTDYAGGWLFKGHCKTQYAAEHGWEHFLRCHRTIVSILDFWQRMGVIADVNDEGGYWETRSEEELRATLGSYDRLIAAVAGVFKDASDEGGKSNAIESPIFARANFEQLEAEGWRELAGRISPRRRSI